MAPELILECFGFSNNRRHLLFWLLLPCRGLQPKREALEFFDWDKCHLHL